MGRKAGKLKVSFIENQKTRILTFKRRSECLLKKAQELSTLCGVDVCMLLYAPDHDAPTAPVSVWPPNDPALVDRLFRQYRGKNLNKDVDDELAQFSVHLRERAQHARAQICQLLMDDDDDDAEQQQQQQQQQDQQFGESIDLDNSSTELIMPRGPLMMMLMDEADCDNNGGLHHSSLSQEDQFGPLTEDDGEEEGGLKQLSSSSFGNNYHHPQQQLQLQYELTGPQLYQGENSSTSMMPSDPHQMMMMMDDTITADQSWCSISGMVGFDEQEQDDVASSSRDDVATTAYDDDYDFIAQLYTPPRPPMMTFQDKSWAAADYIHLDDLWV